MSVAREIREREPEIGRAGQVAVSRLIFTRQSALAVQQDHVKRSAGLRFVPRLRPKDSLVAAGERGTKLCFLHKVAWRLDRTGGQNNRPAPQLGVVPVRQP